MSRKRFLVAVIVLWSVSLLVLRAAASHWDPGASRDNRAYALALRHLGVAASSRIVAVDKQLNGLPFYGYNRFEAVTMEPLDYPFFAPPELLADELKRNAAEPGKDVYLVPPKKLSHLQGILAQNGRICRDTASMLDLTVVRCAFRAE